MSDLNLDLKDLKYIVLPGKLCHPDYLAAYEGAYNFWFENWTAVFQDLKVDKTPKPDDFFRQDFIPIIVYKDKVIAIHLYTLYDLRTSVTLGHSYLAYNFNTDYFEKLKNLGVRKVMSMEALFVDPSCRKSKTGIHFSEAIICLGQRIFSEYTDADGIIAPARCDNKVAAMAYTLGFQPVIEGITLNNVQVDFVLFERGRAIAQGSQGTDFVIRHLWNSRKLATGMERSRKVA